MLSNFILIPILYLSFIQDISPLPDSIMGLPIKEIINYIDQFK